MSRSAAREITRELIRAGWTVTRTRNGHYRAHHPDNPKEAMFYASTPSDHRFKKNVRALARRIRRST